MGRGNKERPTWTTWDLLVRKETKVNEVLVNKVKKETKESREIKVIQEYKENLVPLEKMD